MQFYFFRYSLIQIFNLMKMNYHLISFWEIRNLMSRLKSRLTIIKSTQLQKHLIRNANQNFCSVLILWIKLIPISMYFIYVYPRENRIFLLVFAFILNGFNFLRLPLQTVNLIILFHLTEAYLLVQSVGAKKTFGLQKVG